MSYLKKHIYFLFIVAICLQSLPIKSAEFMYVPVPGAEIGEIVEFGNSFSEMISGISEKFSDISENPKVMFAAGATVFGAMLFAGRGKMVQWADAKAQEIERAIQEECAKGEKQLEKCSPKNQWLFYLLKPSVGGLREQVDYAKRPIGFSTAIIFMGSCLGSPAVGGLFGSLPLIWAWLNRRDAIVDGRFNGVDGKLGVIDTKVSEANKLLGEVNGKADALTLQLSETKTIITGQIQSLQTAVSIDIEKVGTNLTELDKKLKDVPQQILQLTSDLKAAQEGVNKIQGSNATIMQQNNTMVEQTKALSQQLTDATQEFVATKKEFDVLGKTLTEQVKKLAEDTSKQVAAIQEQAGKQVEDIQHIKTNISEKFEELFKNVTDNNLLLQSFENIQKSQGEQLTELTNKVNVGQESDKEMLARINAITNAQENSALEHTKIVSTLNDIRAINTQSIDAVCSRMDNLDKKIAEMEKGLGQVKNQVQDNHQVVISEISANRGATAALGDKLEKSEQARKEKHKKLKKLMHEQTNLINQLFAQGSKTQTQITEIKRDIAEQTAIAAETNALTRDTNFIARSATGMQNSQLLPAPTGEYVTIADDATYQFSSQRNSFQQPKLLVKPLPQGSGFPVFNRGSGQARLTLAPGQPSSNL
jgi:chromosome segregation ATPase